jgi:uncharacterized protein (DUF305 family)
MTETQNYRHSRSTVHTGNRPTEFISKLKVAACLMIPLCTSGLGGITQASEPAPAVAPAVYEPEFLRMMIDHHAMAVEMAELCPSRAVHAELSTMCTSIVDTQQQEIAKMKSWLSDWYGIAYKPQMTPHEMKDVESMAATSGEDFERDFLLSMTPHHMVAIENAGECLARAYHTRLIDECKTIVTSQASEAAMMRGWLAKWYGIQALNFMRSATIGPASAR